MTPEAAADVPDDLEQLRRHFEDFRSTRPPHSRLPESLWAAAAELAKRYGVNPTARALRLEYARLRKLVENRGQAKRKRAPSTPPTFMEFVAPIHSCELCGANAFDYLTELQRHAAELKNKPSDWMPWNYRDTLRRIAVSLDSG